MRSTGSRRLLMAAAVLAATISGQGAAPLLPDLAIRETPNGIQLFVADARRGALRMALVAPDTPSVAVGTMTTETPCGSLNRPAAVTVHRSVLTVVQAEPAPAVVQCNLDTGDQRVLLKGEPLRYPTSVAVAADGTVVVLDRALGALVVVKPGDGVKPRVARVSDALIVRADDRGQLYAVDGRARGIVPINPDETGGRASSDASSMAQQSRPAPSVVTLQGEPSSFAVYKDVFYVTEAGGGTRAQLAGGRLSLEIPDMRPRQAAIAVSRTHLATLDRGAESIDLIARPVPAGVVLDHMRGNPNAAWLQLLDYLAGKRLLARDRVPVAPGDSSYEQVLKRHGVLLKVEFNEDHVAVPEGRTKSLFCAMNPTLCEPGFAGTLPYVVIPQAAPQPVLQTDTRPLEGRTVRAWVDELVLLDSQRKEVTDGYLAARNPAADSSLETELLRRKMVLATPMDPELSAGTIIQIADGRERTLGRLSASCGGLEPSTSKTSLLSQFTAPRAVLPGQVASSRDERVQISVGAWTRSAISLKALADCRPPEDNGGAYVITESLAASDLSIQTLPPLPPNRQALPAPRLVAGPLYVGYKVVPLSGLSAGVALPVADPERVKPPTAGPSALWSIKDGRFTLPVTRWRADVLLPAEDFYKPDGAIQQLRKANAAIDLSPLERLDRAAYSSGAGRPEGLRYTPVHGLDDAEVMSALDAARTGLEKAIKYDRPLALASGTEDVTIGVVEHSGSLSKDHPGFADGGESAWLDFVEGSGLQPHRPAGPADTPIALSLRRADTATEHGTHVAGVIGARNHTARTLGMLPNTKLYLVPSDNMSDLKDNIENARTELVFLFNMSLGFKPETTPQAVIESLHSRIQESWSNALFVVAAGNDGSDLNATGAPAPVTWAASLPNVLTVGASDDRGENVLGQHQDGQDPEETKGSNFGSLYVDLLAPGRAVHSFGSAGYAYACGSSQAAPQVTATAAMLWNAIRRPEIVRARLIYTAEWKKPNFDKKVWGGLLDVKRAVFFPKTNVFYHFPPDTTPRELKLEVGAAIKINGDIRLRNGSSSTPFRDDRFPFSRVLRLTSLGGGRHRVVLLNKDDDVLTIVEGTVSGSIKCKGVKKYDDATQQFSLNPEQPVDCQQGLSLGQIKDYIAATPTSVRFP